MSTEISKTSNSGIWLRRVVALCFLILAGVTTFWLGFGNDTSSNGNGGLVIATKWLCFGEVWEQKDFAWELLLQNPTTKHITIEKFRSTCWCQKIEPCSLTIKAGDSAKIRLTLDLRHRKPKQNSGMRDFTVGLVPLLKNESIQCAGWRIQGRVRVALHTEPSRVDFGRNLIRGAAGVKKIVRLFPHKSLEQVRAKSNSSLRLKLKAPTDKKKFYELIISPRIDLRAGKLSTDAVLDLIVKNGEALPALEIPISGRVVQPVRVLPPALVLGNCAVGESVAETLSLQSRTAEAFEVTGVSSDSPLVKVQRLGSKGGESSYQVRCQITKRGHQQTKIGFTVESGREKRRFNINVPLVYDGISKEQFIRP